MSVREDGKNNILSAGKSATCDRNEVWASLYGSVDI